MWIFCFPAAFSPGGLPLDDTCCFSYSIGLHKMVIFLNYFSFYIYQLALFYEEEFSLFLFLFLCLPPLFLKHYCGLMHFLFNVLSIIFFFFLILILSQFGQLEHYVHVYEFVTFHFDGIFNLQKHFKKIIRQWFSNILAPRPWVLQSLKNYQTLSTFCLCGFYLSIFTYIEIKTETLKKY